MANGIKSISITRTPVIPPAAVASAACCCPACSGLECLDRTRFFAGQLLTEADLNNEQSYLLAKNRLHNRYLHGWGVVCGMQVVCGDCDGWVTIKTGYALDPCGNDIIVCEDYPFNIIKAIRDCCTPPKATNCSPLRYTPSPTCQDAVQTWCVTIEYQEQQTRMVTPLRPAPPKTNGCGCGCGSGSPAPQTQSASPACGCASPQVQTSPSTNGSCEPTRIAEGFTIGVIPAPVTNPDDTSPQPGTIDYQISICLAALQNVLAAAPQLDPNGSQITAYQAVCNYLAMVKNALAKAYVTHCQLESQLAGIQVSSSADIPTLQGIVDTLVQIVRAAALDCICSAFVPPCPGDPCDDRLILACVTVQNGKIINICHFGGRRQVITFPVLYYWLSLFGIDKIFSLITTLLGRVCCGPEELRYSFFASDAFQRESVSNAGATNPATVVRTMAYALSQKMGANLVNAVAPTTQAVDLRPLIGQNLETFQSAAVRKYRLQNLTVKDVTGQAAWNDASIAAAAQFAPPAVSLTQPLTVFVTGQQKTIVGFDVTDPVEVLQNQVAQLQAKLDSFNAPSPAHGAAAAPATRAKRKGTK